MKCSYSRSYTPHADVARAVPKTAEREHTYSRLGGRTLLGNTEPPSLPLVVCADNQNGNWAVALVWCSGWLASDCAFHQPLVCQSYDSCLSPEHPEAAGTTPRGQLCIEPTQPHNSTQWNIFPPGPNSHPSPPASHPMGACTERPASNMQLP